MLATLKLKGRLRSLGLCYGIGGRLSLGGFLGCPLFPDPHHFSFPHLTSLCMERINLGRLTAMLIE